MYNVEFEFWNINFISSGDYYCKTYLQPDGYTCDTTGALNYYTKLIRQVDSLANIIGVVSETYVGWFNQSQAIIIGNTVDRILLHDYISNYSCYYSYIQTRLQYIAARNMVTKVIPIFSAEPSFMGPWLSTNNVVTPFLDLQTALANDSGTWKQYINLYGCQWFAYSFMPINTSTSILNNVEEVEVKLFPNPTNDILNVQLKNMEGIQVEFQNSIGQIMSINQTVTGNQIAFDISNIKSGIYVCLIKSRDQIISRKIVVN